MNLKFNAVMPPILRRYTFSPVRDAPYRLRLESPLL